MEAWTLEACMPACMPVCLYAEWKYARCSKYVEANPKLSDLIAVYCSSGVCVSALYCRLYALYN
jgi:hypothetical protein